MSFVCPICGKESHHPTDEAEGYCAACHGFTASPPPPGFAWVLFSGGPMDGRGRLIEEDFLRIGNSYELAWVQPKTPVIETEGRYIFDGEKFVHD